MGIISTIISLLGGLLPVVILFILFLAVSLRVLKEYERGSSSAWAG